MNAELEKRLRAWHDADSCSERWEAVDCDGTCCTMRELRAAARIALEMAAEIAEKDSEDEPFDVGWAIRRLAEQDVTR